MTHLTTERISDGYKLSFSVPFETTELVYDGANWILTTEWIRATDSLRARIISILYNSRTSLFKNSPSQKTLENLLLPWVIINDAGDMLFNCKLPLPESNKEGTGKIVIVGITIRQSGITPNWHITDYAENTPVVEFDWNEVSSTSVPENEFREITLIESEVPSEDTTDTLRLNTDEQYNTRKFAAKERVKEARLKAILARRAAEVETNRYYSEFSIGDNESSFSEYDISDYSDESDQEEESERKLSEA